MPLVDELNALLVRNAGMVERARAHAADLAHALKNPLTVIQNAIDQIRASGRDLHTAADGTQLYEPEPGTENDIGLIPLDDEASYEAWLAEQAPPHGPGGSTNKHPLSFLSVVRKPASPIAVYPITLARKSRTAVGY